MKRILHFAVMSAFLLLASCGTTIDRTTGNGNPVETQVATPVITPSAGTYPSAITITISTTTENAEIYYTLDGTDPTESSTLYTAPFLLSQTASIIARGFRSDLLPSLAAQNDFVIGNNANQVAAPTITPPGGTYTSPLSITIATTTAGANIYYTLDGTDPTQNSTLYVTPFPLSQNATVKTAAFLTGMAPSSVTTESYTFDNGTPTETAQIEIAFNCDGTDRLFVNDGIMSFSHISGGIPNNPWVQVTRPDGSVTTLSSWNKLPYDLQLNNLVPGSFDFIPVSSLQVIYGRDVISIDGQNQITIHDGPSGFSLYWFIFQYSYPVPAK